MRKQFFDVSCPTCRWNTKRLHADDGGPRKRRAPSAPYGFCSTCDVPLDLRKSLVDPNWRQIQARNMAARIRELAALRRHAIGERYPDKGTAYRAGYRQGYYTAMRWWRFKYESLRKQQQGRPAA